MKNNEIDSIGLRDLARRLGQTIGRDVLRLGTVLGAIRRGRFWLAWGFTDFDSYVSIEVGLSYTTAWRAMRVDEFVVRERLSKAEATSLAELGITKAAIVAGCASKGSIGSWIKIARGSTVPQLIARARGETAAEAPRVVGLWLYPEQRRSLSDALKIAAERTETGYHGDCLAIICEDYIKRHGARRRRA